MVKLYVNPRLETKQYIIFILITIENFDKNNVKQCSSNTPYSSKE